MDDIINMQILHNYVENVGVSALYIQSQIIEQEVKKRHFFLKKYGSMNKYYKEL